MPCGSNRLEEIPVIYRRREVLEAPKLLGDVAVAISREHARVVGALEPSWREEICLCGDEADGQGFGEDQVEAAPQVLIPGLGMGHVSFPRPRTAKRTTHNRANEACSGAL